MGATDRDREMASFPLLTNHNPLGYVSLFVCQHMHGSAAKFSVAVDTLP